MVHVVHVVVMMMMVVMMVMHRRFCVNRGRSSGRAGSRFRRDGISGEAKGEDGRGRKGLDHGRTFPVV
jgi:hypothetical protein